MKNQNLMTVKKTLNIQLFVLNEKVVNKKLKLFEFSFNQIIVNRIPMTFFA